MSLDVHCREEGMQSAIGSGKKMELDILEGDVGEVGILDVVRL